MIRKICPHCNNDNPQEAVFCKKCGALFVGQPEFVNLEEKKRKKINNLKNKLIFAVCIILLVVAMLIFKSGSVKGDETINSPSASDIQTTHIDTESTAVSTTAVTTTAPTTTAAPVTTDGTIS